VLPGPDLPDTPFTHAEARARGVTSRQLQRMLEGCEVRRVLTGVYVAGHVPDSLHLRCAAARRVLSPHAVVCDRTAAWIWNVDTFDYRELEILPPIETYVLRGHNRTRRPECAGGVRDLLADEIVTLDGIKVTTPLRTAVDLACKLPERDGLAALDGFRRGHHLEEADLRRQLARHFRRRGVVRARRLVAWADPRAESPGESRTRWELLRRGMPEPELQWSIVIGGREVCRLDLAYPKHRVAVEYDGREFHEDDDRREHDRLRREWLERRGWTVVVVTKDDCTPEAVEDWVLRVAEALRLAA
jgi:very-short-patch-repair endonuclease